MQELKLDRAHTRPGYVSLWQTYRSDMGMGLLDQSTALLGMCESQVEVQEQAKLCHNTHQFTIGLRLGTGLAVAGCSIQQ